MINIEKIILHNFKRFNHLELEVDEKINILIGDNESGKSSIIEAIDLVSKGSRQKIESIGLERLFNIDAIKHFMETDIRNINDLPQMFVELYFTPIHDEELEGCNNSKNINTCGIKMICSPNDDYSRDISNIISLPDAVFPIEYYKIEFYTFSGAPYNGYTKKINTLLIDNSQIGSPKAMREYVKDIYYSSLSDENRRQTRHEYHNAKTSFQRQFLSQYSTIIEPYEFAVKETSEDNIETDITLTHNNIPIENKGTGKQCFIKTEMALKKSIENIDTVLIEEPETHLSYMNMLKLIDKIKETSNRQLFISTHSDLIASRLNLKKCILLNSTSQDIIKLNDISEDTAKFFMKAPDNNLLQFILSNKVMLVEGDAEFILMEALYKNTQGKNLATSGIGVISVDGKCFKRYLEVAKILNIKTVVITDNDKDYENNISKNYEEYIEDCPNIKIFSDSNNERNTFEVCIYKDNKDKLDELFKGKPRTKTIQEYMLDNKAEVAFEILCKIADELIVPDYIKNAIRWIDE